MGWQRVFLTDEVWGIGGPAFGQLIKNGDGNMLGHGGAGEKAWLRCESGISWMEAVSTSRPMLSPSPHPGPTMISTGKIQTSISQYLNI